MATKKSTGKGKKNVYAGVGISKADNPVEAGKEAIDMAIAKMKVTGGKKPDFAFLFCSGSKYGKDAQTLKKLVDNANSLFKKSNEKIKWVGCTTAGEISNYGVTEGSCVVMVIQSDYVRVGLGIGANANKEPEKAGDTAVRMALKDLKMDRYVDPYMHFLAMKQKSVDELAKLNPYSFYVLTNGPTLKAMSNESRIINGITKVVGTNCPLIGGSAADDGKFDKTYVFANGQVYEDHVIVMANIINLMHMNTLEHGYKDTGKTVFVDDAEGHLVKIINKKPAVDAFSEAIKVQLKKDPKNPVNILVETINSPLGFPDINGNIWLRDVVFGLPDGSMLFGPEIPKNVSLHIMKGAKEDVINASKKGINEMKKTLPGELGYGLFFSCFLRKIVLGKDIQKEMEYIAKNEKFPFVGFYTYGEIGGKCNSDAGYHNQTISMEVVSNKVISEK